MSMIGNLIALEPAKLEELIAQPEQLEPFLYPDDGDSEPEHHLDLDKSWHAIHFTLNGKAWEGEGALGNVIIGGQEIGENIGYGPARYLTPREVLEAAQALQSIPPDQFKERFNPNGLTAAEIYPEIWAEEPEESLDYVLSFYEDLRNFYLGAADRGQAVLIYLN